jgi:hypothetical protein
MFRLAAVARGIERARSGGLWPGAERLLILAGNFTRAADIDSGAAPAALPRSNKGGRRRRLRKWDERFEGPDLTAGSVAWDA